MGATHHMTDGETNWSFCPHGNTVTFTVTRGYGVISSEEINIEEGREIFKNIKRFNPLARKGFTKLGKLRKLTTEAQVIEYDNGCREWYGEDNWPEFSLATWEQFQGQGYLVVYG